MTESGKAEEIMNRYAIGLDYGTLSARAVLVDTQDGNVAAECTYVYPHGVMDTQLPDGTPLPQGWALQHPSDYLKALDVLIPALMRESGVSAGQVIGIGLGCTSASILPVYHDKTPLCLSDTFAGEKHAYVKLWKHHGADAEAEQVCSVARERHESWLAAYGGNVSSEWTVPKVLETLRHAPDVYENADLFMEVMDWLVWVLTDTLCFSECAAGYKAFYQDGRYPDTEFFRALDPRMEHFIEEKFHAPVRSVGTCAGLLSDAMAARLNLHPGIPVGVPMVDAHCSVPGGGVDAPGEMMIIMGTSACHLMLSEQKVSMDGIQGVVRNGMMPGFYGVEAGQSCVGEHFAWAVEQCFPEAYAREANALGLSRHELMARKLEGYRPGASGLLALDWFNGVRSPLMDFDLNGLILGMHLQTRPEEIYLALMEATAYGTRLIVELYEKHGVPVRQILLSGGIPVRNPLLVQIYADVLERPVRVCGRKQASAVGAALLGMAAAGKGQSGYADLREATRAHRRVNGDAILPRKEHVQVYRELYSEYVRLLDYFGRGGNDVMRHLNRLRAANHA